MSDTTNPTAETATPAGTTPAPEPRKRRRAGDGPELSRFDDAQCLDNQGAARLLGVDISTFYSLQRDDPDFPEPIHLLPGNRLKRWPVRVLREYIDRKITEAGSR